MKTTAPNHAGFSRPPFFLRQGLLALLTALLGLPSISQAQPPITPSGLHTQVSDPITIGPTTQYNITGGTRPGGGANLFHSFGEFGVPPDNIANFLNDTGLPTSNILGRVTSGDISNIFGTIQTTGFGNANLFLMNPAGFLFGPNATVNVGGMVAFTSADYLKLTDNARFNAIPNAAADTLLTALPVASFGFLGSNPGAITVRGSLFSVTDGQSISLVGGNISIESGTPDGGTAQPARLSAPSGNILLASAVSPGEFAAATLQPLPNVDGASFTSYGSIALVAGSSIYVSSANTVSIRGGRFVLSMNDAILTTSQTAGPPETISLSRGSSIVGSTTVTNDGGVVEITADKLAMDGAAIKSTTIGTGHGMDIAVTTNQLELSGGAQIASNAGSTGAGGDINISVSESVSISGYDTEGTLPGIVTIFTDPNSGLPLVTSGLFSSTSGSGNGGHISISNSSNSSLGPAVTLDNAGQIATLTSGAGRGGDITMNNTSSLTLENGAQLLSSSGVDLASNTSSGIGPGGNISITASGQVLVSGGNLELFANTQILSQSIEIGDNGHIILQAPSISFEEGGRLVSSKSVSSSDSPGLHGNISLITDSLTISGAFDFEGDLSPSGIETIALGPLSQTSGINAPLAGGNIFVSSAYVSVDQGFISSRHQQQASGGNLVFDVGDLNIINGGSIRVHGDGTLPTGRVLVTASGLVEVSGVMDGTHSAIENVARNSGHGGDIDISAHQVLVSNGGRINSETRGLDGHSISISAEESVLVSNGGKIRINGGSFDPGSLTISAPSILLDQGILQTKTAGTGNAGSAVLTADHVMLTGGQIRSETEQTTGTGGNITIQASKTISISGQFSGNDVDDSGPAGIFAQSFRGGGNAGNVSLTAPVVTVADGGQINSSTSSDGLGGNIDILATNSLSLSGNGSGLLSETTASGHGGTIHAKVNQLEVKEGAVVSAKSSGTGNAGSVVLEGTASPANSVLIDGSGSGIFTEAQGTGAGGNILIETSQSTTLTNGAAVSASSIGTMDNAGNAGMVTIHAGNTFFMQNSSVTTQATKSGGGQIEINAADLFRLANSRVSSSVLDGTGGGGNITIDPNVVVLQNSQIIAQAVQGAGGNITITTPLFLADSTSLVNASSQFGLNGTVTIQSPTSNLSGSLGPLSSTPSQAQSLLTQRCAALANGQASSFVVAGREQLPADPGGWLSGPIALAGIDVERFGEGTVAEGTSNLAPRTSGLLANDRVSLRRLTPSGFLIANFADSEATGCHS